MYRRGKREMRWLAGWAPLLLFIGCSNTPSATSVPTAMTVSCQPFGYTPAPIAFSFAPGPVTPVLAEQTALAMVRACMQPSAISARSHTKAATGLRDGPNEGQAVWLVQVDATVTDASPAPGYDFHFMIEVNQATGIPTLVAYG